MLAEPEQPGLAGESKNSEDEMTGGGDAADFVANVPMPEDDFFRNMVERGHPMRNLLQAALALSVMIAVPTALRAQQKDDWSFIAGKYAVEPADCKHPAKGRPFSKNLVKAIDAEVMTRERITSPRETHCKLRSSKKDAAGKTRTVKAACEELGDVSQEELKVAANADGSVVVTSEDVFGFPLTFKPCPK
jgi:hypothetical protein